MKPDRPTKDPRLISYNTLRITIGWLGILLPAAMLAVNFLFGCNSVQDSNSHYYYTVSGNLFTGILFAVALFLFAYKGFERIDHISTSLAAVFALGIALLPTNDTSADSCAILHLPANQFRNIAHYSFAALFFITLACISLFLFTKSRGTKTNQKDKRNMVYRVCGIIILVAIVAIALCTFLDKNHMLDKYKLTFWLEWVALIAFGASWLVKGELVLKDNDHK